MGEPVLVGQGKLCFANWREVADPPLRMVQTWSATLRAWEDLRFLGTWNAAANCFDGQNAWQTDPATNTVTPTSHAHVRCVATTCATEDAGGVCELRGMRSACIEDEPALAYALGAQSGIASAMQHIQSSSLEAMDSATNRIHFWRQLQNESLPASERAMLTSKSEVWYQHHQAAVVAWNLSSSVLQQHVVEQARSVLGRLPVLSGLLDEAFSPSWSDSHTITDLTQDVLEAIENRVADYSLTYSEIMTVLGYGRVTMQQLQLDESNPRLTTQTQLAQLQLEIAAQLVSMGLQTCSLAVAEQLHTASNGTEFLVLEAQVLDVAHIASNWQHKAGQLLALWQQVLDERFPGISGAESPNVALHCLGQKAAEARRLITAFGEGLQWAPSDGETGFAACRDFHTPRIDVAMDVQTSASDAADADLGLVGVRAKTENGDRQLCYLPSAGSVTEPLLHIDRLFAGSNAAVELHMPDTFEDWSASGRRLAEPAASNTHLCGDGAFCAGTVPRMVAAAPENHGRALDQSCNTGTIACGTDLWCNVATWQLEYVGHGYYSPDGDCSRSSCTSMESEAYGMDNGMDTGSAFYTASGGGTDQCPWGCGGGDYAQVIQPFGTYMCVQVGVGEWSPPGSKLIFQW